MRGTGEMYESGLEREDAETWSTVVTVGVLVTLLGIAALLAVSATGLFTVILMGLALVAAGALELFHAISGRRGRSQRALRLVESIFSIVVGALILARPAAGLATISLLLAMFFIANGLFRIIGAVGDRFTGWGVDLLYGLTAVALGFYVAARWPASSLWLLGTIIGIEIVARGLMLLAVGFELRRALRADVSRRAPQPT